MFKTKFWFLDSNLKGKSIKKTLFFLLLLFSCHSLISQRYWISSTSANWSGNNWSNTSGGVPDGGGPPSGSDNAIFDANGNGNCLVDVSATFDGITVNNYTGTIDINGQNISITGTNTCIFATGTINDTPGTSVLQINTSGFIRFSGTNFGAELNITGGIDFDGGTFNGDVTANHNTTNQYGAGGCTFNGQLHLTNSGATEIRLGTSNPDIFNGDVHLFNTGTSELRLAHNSLGNQFNGDIYFDMSGGASGISICESNGDATLAAGTNLLIGTDVTDGNIILNHLTQSDATNINLDLNGTARILMSYNHFLGNLHIQSPRVYVRENVFDGDIYLEKEGATNDATHGGNIFNGNTDLILTGSGYFMLGNSAADIFNGDLSISNQGSAHMYLAYGTTGNQFNGNVSVENTGSNDIRFCETTSSGATLASGQNISVGTLGFNAGYLRIMRLTQIGATPQNIALTGSALLQVFYSSFDGALNFSAPRFSFGDNTFNDLITFNKTSSGDDNCNGGNTFNSSATFIHTGADDWFFGTSNPDTFNGVSTFRTVGSSNARIFPARNTSGNLFNESIILENTNSGGVYIGSSGGSAQLANTKTITIGSGGFDSGILYLFNITQVGTTPISLSATGTAAARCSGNNFQGDFSLTAPEIYLDLNTFASNNFFEKTGNNNNSSDGGNTFGGTTQMINSSSNYFLFGNTAPDIFNDDLFVSNTGSGIIYLAHNSTGNQFNGNIELVNTIGSGIRFSQGGTGTSTLAATKTITVGSGGFTNGSLYIDDFTQVGATSQNLTLDPSARLYMDAVNWGGDLQASAGFLETVNGVFSGITLLSQTGSIGSPSSSNNLFQQNVTLNNSSDRDFQFGVGNPDIFQDNLIVNNSGNGNTSLGYNSAGNTISNDLTLNNFGNGMGIYLLNTGATPSMTVGGNVILNESSSNNHSNSLGNSGTLLISGDLTVNNNSTATNCYTYVANTIGSQVTVDGVTQLNNNGAATSNQELRIGWNGSVIFNQGVTASNQSTASNSFIRFAYTANASAQFNDNLVVESTVTGVSGITFGEAGGTSTLADTKTVTTGSGGYVDGILRFSQFNQIGSTPQTLTLTTTAYLFNENSDWGGNVTFSSPRHRTDGSTYRGSAQLTKTGSSDDNSSGGNVYFGALTLTHTGDNNFLHGQYTADTCLAGLTVSNEGTGHFYFAHGSVGNYVNGDIVGSNINNGRNFYLASNAGSSLEVTGNVIFQANSANTVRNCIPCSGSMTVGGNYTISDASTSGNSETYLANSTGSSLDLAGNLSVDLTASGTTGRFYLSNSGSATIHGTAYFSNHSTANNSEIYISNNGGSSTTFNDNIIVESYALGSSGIRFGNNSGTSSLANTKTITVGSNGYNTGILYLRNFTQIGGTPQNLLLTGDAYLFVRSSDWGGNVDFTGPRFRTDETLYQGTALLEKSGGVADDRSQGNNIFQNDATLTNSGSNYFLMGENNPDTFLGDLTVNNNGTNHFYLAYTSAGNSIAGDFYCNNTNAAGNTQVSTGTVSSLNITGDVFIDMSSSHSNSNLYFPNSGSIDIGGNLQLDQTTTGTSSNSYFASGSSSQLTVTGDLNINNNGSGTTSRVFLGNSGPFTINGNTSIVNNSLSTNSEVYVAQNASSLGSFNGNIELSSVSNNDGIYFGASNGSSTLANGFTISVASSGFDGNRLYLRNFTQLGTTPQNVVTTGPSTVLEFFSSQWNAASNFESAGVLLRSSIYNGTSSFKKTGSNTDQSVGGNIFNDATSFENSGSGLFRLAYNSGYPDDYNADVTFTESSTGEMRPSCANTDTYAANIFLNSSSEIYFGQNGAGRVLLDGSLDQNITDLVGTTYHRMRDLEVSKSGGDVYLGTNLLIVSEIDLNQGIVYTDVNHIIEMTDNSIVSNVSNNSHIDGPVDKSGNDSFTFPVGDNGFYRPISMSSPSSTSARFRSQYFDVDPNTVGYNDGQKESSLGYISDCEYWILNREATSNNVSVTLSYDTYRGPCSGVTDPTLLKVARWDAATSEWKNHGNGGSTGTTSGTVSTAGVVTNFSPFTFASDDIDVNPLPITLISFKATANGSTVDLDWQTGSEINNDYFTIERSVDGITFYPILTTDGAGNSNSTLDYHETDVSPISGISYYRLKQTDFNGEFSYSHVEVVELTNGGSGVNIFPNPIAANQGDLTLVFATTGNKEIKIIDQLGKIVLAQISTSDLLTNINVSSLQSGVYFVQINESGHTYTERFIIE